MNPFKRIINYPAKKANIVDIDFNKPWWNIFLKLKWNIFIVFIFVASFNVLNTIFPILISWAIQSKNFYNIGLVTLIYLIEEASALIIWTPQATLLFSRIVESFSFNAYKILLAIDPVYHTQQSSGISIGKIKRTAEAYKDISKNLLYELIPLVISIVTSIISLSFFDFYLGVVSGLSLVSIGILFCIVTINFTYTIEKQNNYDDDQASHTGTESIIQATFIRSTFASNQILYKLNNKYLKVMRSTSTLYMSYHLMRGLFIMCYIACTGGIAMFLLNLINKGTIAQITALSLLMTILRSTQPLLKIDKRVKDTLSAYRKIKDFYRFVNRFGKRTFPVYSYQIKETERIQKKDPITLTMQSISISFQQNKPLFSNISLDLSVPQSEHNKLYGIIGPSGIGKTTLISIIGGQLNPPTGKILIDGYNIYNLNDEQRRRLIALQCQTASSLHGSLKYNLTFGLPYNHTYSDDELINMIDAVGLWKLFKAKEGLNTMVGESGMTLSGGQRQRLNFANLYLRAQTFKPAIILIDEPTSSLDEISEQKITDMINELARESLTLVIAHRLKTLENAQKILDLCTLKEGEALDFQTQETLKKTSEYYRRLISGQARIEE